MDESIERLQETTKIGGIEIRLQDAHLDEVVAHNCWFHLEQMQDTAWWMGIKQGDKYIHVWLTLEDGQIKGEWRDESPDE